MPALAPRHDGPRGGAPPGGLPVVSLSGRSRALPGVPSRVLPDGVLQGAALPVLPYEGRLRAEQNALPDEQARAPRCGVARSAGSRGVSLPHAAVALDALPPVHELEVGME